MQNKFTTVDDYVELLTEKGYLASNFKTPTQAGAWIEDFHQSFEHARRQAELKPPTATLVMPLTGLYDERLTKVKFNLWFRYDQRSGELKLFKLQTSMNKGDIRHPHAARKKIYKITDPAELILPSRVYETLSKPDQRNDRLPQWLRLYREFDRDHRQDIQWDKNDVVPDTDPLEALRTTDEIPEELRPTRRETGLSDPPRTSVRVGIPDHIKAKFRIGRTKH